MKNLNRWTSLVLATVCAVSTFVITPMQVKATEYWPTGPEIESPNAIVMEASTGTILYEKNSHEQHYPASITKIMTALLALESDHTLDETVTFSHDAIYNVEGSSMSRDVGEEMTLEQCMYGMLLNSANECAYAIAEHVGGTVENFVDMMNAKAKELGCTDTHFANPHGLTDENHYTSAYDMALIAREAYKNETFRIIVGTKNYTIPPTNKHDDVTYCQNHNELLNAYKTSKYLYQYCTGGKTGYTDAANSTLVTYAEKDGMTLICVIMNATSPSQWTDSTSLYDYCFDNFQVLNVADNESRYDDEIQDVGALNINNAYVKLDSDGVIVLPKTAEFLEAEPEITYDNESDDVVATLQYTFADHVVGGADIIATGTKIDSFQFDNQQVEESTESIGTTETTETTGTTQKKKIFQINIRMILAVLVGFAVILVIIYLIKIFINNFYIIRYKFCSKQKRYSKYKTIKDTRKSKRKKHKIGRNK